MSGRDGGAPTAVKARLDESEQNMGMLKSGIMQLLRFLEGRKA